MAPRAVSFGLNTPPTKEGTGGDEMHEPGGILKRRRLGEQQRQQGRCSSQCHFDDAEEDRPAGRDVRETGKGF